MKLLKLAFILSSFIILISFMKKSDTNLDPRNLLGQHLTVVGNRFEKKYGFLPIGTSVAFPDSLNSAGIAFTVDHQINKADLYKILYEIASDLKDTLNSDEALQCHMKSYPFDLENIDIILFFKSKPNERYFHPDIDVARLSYGYYHICTVDPENEFQYKTATHEKFTLDLIK
jgi:hypothetical protein